MKVKRIIGLIDNSFFFFSWKKLNYHRNMNDINIFMGDDLSVYQLCQLYLVRINQVNCIQIQLIGKRVEYII